MARRGIDMLPLLDVFMVVLFVFATIQEQQLDTSTQELDEARAALAVAEAEQLAAQTLASQLDAELSSLEARSRQQTREVEALSERVEEYERECGPRRLDGPACPAAALNPNATAQLDMAALHERLLDNVAVFEVELEGDPDFTTGKIRNRCCYRADPPTGIWRGCGVVPSEAIEQLGWLDDGAQGLVDGLSRTRGGNAVVMLSQGGLARYRISNDLAELLRERFPDHRVYDDGMVSGPPDCPLLTK